jgi:alpha-galactosidase
MSIKIVLVGAGSRSFGPASVRDILLSDALNEAGVDLVLMDKVAANLEEIEAYASRLNSKLERKARITATTELIPAVTGAHFVVTAIEVDRFFYWSQDFHVPRKYGFKQVFGENGGPGGLFHALRNMGPILEIAHAMEQHCPAAVMLNFTNPEHKLCEALSRLSSIQNVGLCHGVFDGIRQIAHLLGRPAEELDLAACGINHFTFFQKIRDRKTGEDLYPALREAERRGDWLSDWHELALGRILFRRFGLWPSPAANHYGEYIRWADEFVASELQYFYDPAGEAPWRTRQVPEWIYSLSGDKTTRPWIKPGSVREKLEDAPLKPSGELAVPIMEGLACGLTHELPAINVTNRGTIPNLPDDLVIEAPAIADHDGLRTVPMQPLPEALAAMLRLQGSIHKLLVEAYAERSRDKLLQALLLDPTVDSYHRAALCLDEMLELQAGILPAFK